MKHLAILIVWGAWLLACSAMADEPKPGEPPAAAKPAAPSPRVVEWLDKLEARGKQVQSIQASITYDQNDEVLDDRTTRIGTFSYVSPADKAPARFAIYFNQIVVNDEVHTQKLEYVFDGSWLVQRDHKQKYFEKRQVVAPGQEGKLNPIDIDGPFPLPLGQKRKEVLERFDVEIVGPDTDDKPLHLKLTPKADTPQSTERKPFEQIDVWFDKESLLPTKVLTNEGGKKTTVTLKNIKTNVKIDDKFNTDSPGGGWREEIKPWKD